MTTIGFIGSGNIGGTVARLAVAAGHDVVLSNSRGPETLEGLVADLGPKARAATPVEAAEAGDLVVLTIPLQAVEQVPADALAGKVVIDTCNYYPQRDGHIAALDDESTTTSELVQRHLARSKVVKSFNNISYVHLGGLARPAGSPDRSVLAIAGDDAEAKQTVSRLLDSLGYDAYDAGPLAEGWRFQRDTAAYAGLYNGDTSGTWPPPPTAASRSPRSSCGRSWPQRGAIEPPEQVAGCVRQAEPVTETAYRLSEDPSELDMDRVFQWLSGESYWAHGRSRHAVERSFADSFACGAYSDEHGQVAVARLVSDGATFAWFCDVYVDSAHRGRGLGQQLARWAVDWAERRNVPRIVLATRDAHEVYARVGFEPLRRSDTFMEIDRRPQRPPAKPHAGVDGVR